MMRNRHRQRSFFVIAAFALSWFVSHAVYQSVPTGADENSYVFQAHNFLEGHIARPYPPLAQVLEQEMIILDQDAGWLSRYPPAHSLCLVPGVMMGNVYLLIALAAAAGMWLTCAAAAALGIAEALVAFPMLLSPFFAFMYGTQLSHTSGFVAVAAMLWCYILWKQTNRYNWAIAAGLCWSFLFLNRTYTAMLIALPFGIDALLHFARQRDRRAFFGVTAFAASAAVGMAAYLGYNYLAVGDPFTATYLYYEPSEKLGFGPRQTQGMVVHHTLANGWNYFQNNVRSLNQWLFAFKGSAFVLLALALIGWSRRWSILFITATLAVWTGYIYFWYPGVKEAGGPVYFFETLPMLILLCGFGLQVIWDRCADRTVVRLVTFVAALLLLAGVSVSFSVQQGHVRAEQQRIKRQLLDTLHQAPPNSLVIMEDFRKPHIGEIVFNPKGLDSDPLLIRSLYDENAVIQRTFPDRTSFLIRGNDPDHLIPLEFPSGLLSISRDAHNTPQRVGRNEEVGSDARIVERVATADRDPAGWVLFGKHVNLPPGRYRVSFDLDVTEVTEDHPVRVDVSAADGREQLAASSMHGTCIACPVAMDITLTNTSRIEPRAHYGGSGRIAIRKFVIEETAEP